MLDSQRPAVPAEQPPGPDDRSDRGGHRHHLPTSEGAGPLAGWPRPLAFVLSGGAAWGASQVGMLRGLAEAGVTADLIVGTSAGALNGSLLAATDQASAVEQLEEIWRTISWPAISGGNRRRVLWNVLRTRRSLIHPAGLQAAIERWLLVERFEQLRCPFGVVVTDAETLRPEVVTSGRLALALQATAAIPGVFPPVTIDGRSFVDGGASANLPIQQAIDLGARSVVALDATPAIPRPWPPSGPLSGSLLAAAAALHNQRSDDPAVLPADVPVLWLPPVTPASLSSFNFRYSELLMAAGYHNTRNALATRVDEPTR